MSVFYIPPDCLFIDFCYNISLGSVFRLLTAIIDHRGELGMSLTTALVAVLPAIIIVFYIYKKDTREHEPFGLLAKLFFFGLLSIISAVLLESFGEQILIRVFEEKTILYLLLDNFLVVAVAEELGKYVAFKLGAWKNKNFDFTYDAIVYAVCVGIGFAIPENLLYVVDGGFSTAIMRAFTSIPGHIAFAVYMGYYFGQAKACEQAGDAAGKKRFLRRALWIPVLWHGAYDFCLSTDYLSLLIVFIALVIVLDILALKLVKKASFGDRRIDARPHIFVNSNEFISLGMFSKGEESFIYLVTDITEQGRWIAKQMIRAEGEGTDYPDRLQRDIDSYNELTRLGIRMPQLYETDMNSRIMTREFIVGPSLAYYLQSNNMKEEYKDQVMAMSKILRENGLNIDYDPSNFIVRDGMVYYVDYESEPYTEERSFENYGLKLWEEAHAGVVSKPE